MAVSLHRTLVHLVALVPVGWVALGLSDPAGAQPLPVGSPFQVNTYTTGAQAAPAVSASATGDFVVVWRHGGLGVVGRRFDAGGSPLGGEFVVSSGHFPRVASEAGGSFVVVWTASDGSGSGVFGRRYDASGDPVGGEFLVNSYTTNFQTFPSIASSPAGEFIVAWASYPATGYGAEVFGQLYDSAGNRRGGEFLVSPAATPPPGVTESHRDPAASMDEEGGFLVVWEKAYGIPPYFFPTDVLGQRFDASGEPLGSEFMINTYTSYDQRNPAVTSDANGGFTVAWESGTYCIGDTGRAPASDCFTIFGRRFDAQGSPLTGELLASPSGSYSGNADVAAIDADFIVVWQSDPTASLKYEALGRQFDASGHAVGGEFQIGPTGTTIHELNPVVAPVGERGFVVVWEHGLYASGEVDILAQLFTTPSLTLTVDGTCGAPVTAFISNAPPNSEVALIAAANTNGFTKGGALCNGTELEIGEPFQLPPRFVIVDGNGNGSRELVLGPDRCHIQALALANCETSNVVAVP